MNRKEIKKRKKKEKKIEKVSTTYNNEVMRIVKVLLIVLAIFGIVYFVMAWIRGDIKFGKEKKEPTEVTIQYDEILAGETFHSLKSEYYVLFYDYTSNEAGLMDTLVSNYEKKSKEAKVYTVNLKNPLNTRYLTTEESNKNPENAAALRLNGITLIRIQNGKATMYLEGKDAIKEYLVKITND